MEFIEDDYRNIPEGFDAFVSVGMLEHVGHEHYGELAQVIQKAIGNSGRGLLHFIGRNRPQAFSAWIRKRIFPGAYAPTLRESLEILERNNYAVLDVENLRLHYAKTLEHWLERYERAVDRVICCAGVGVEKGQYLNRAVPAQLVLFRHHGQRPLTVGAGAGQLTSREGGMGQAPQAPADDVLEADMLPPP